MKSSRDSESLEVPDLAAEEHLGDWRANHLLICGDEADDLDDDDFDDEFDDDFEEEEDDELEDDEDVETALNQESEDDEEEIDGDAEFDDD